MYETWDNGGASADRYTVFPFRRRKDKDLRLFYFALSTDPESANGVSLCGDGQEAATIRARQGRGYGRRIPFRSLPLNVQAHVIARLKDAT